MHKVESLVFFSLALITVAGAGVLITCTQPLHGAFALVAVAVGIAGLCVLLGAPVLAAVTLFLMGGFGLLCASLSLSLRLAQARIVHRDIAAYLAVFFALLLGVQLLLYSQVAGEMEESATMASANAIASALFADFLLPLHIVILLLLCAMVGTLVATRAEERP